MKIDSLLSNNGQVNSFAFKNNQDKSLNEAGLDFVLVVGTR